MLVVGAIWWLRPLFSDEPATPASETPPALAPTFTPTALAAPAPTPAPQPAHTLIQAVHQDADSFNPVLTTNETSLAVIDKLFPRLLAQDPQTGLAPVSGGGLAVDWRIGEGGQVLTFTLRTDLRWSDGQPVTARDVQFTYQALVSPAVASPYRTLAAAIAGLSVPRPDTLVVRLQQPGCPFLQLLRHPVLPAHAYGDDFSGLRDHPLNQAPTVSAGPFEFVSWTPGQEIVLARRASTATPSGAAAVAPALQRWIFRVVPDAAERRRLLAAGELDLVRLAPGERQQVAALTGVVAATFPENGYTFLALNLADPADPRPGRDDQGQPVPQPPHPILGDLRVRQAIAHAIHIQRIDQAIYQGELVPMASYVLPTVGWAYAPGLAPYAYDPAAAAQLLEEAGWVDRDGDGVREKDGQVFHLTLLTNEDNPRRVQMGEFIQADLAAVGMAVTFQPLPFDRLAQELLGQRFDLALAGWDHVAPDPGLSTFWHSREDRPGTGYNFTSFHDAGVDTWLDQARLASECDPEVRAAAYRAVQEEIHARLPYVLIGSQTTGWAYSSGWQGVLEPAPWGVVLERRLWQEALP